MTVHASRQQTVGWQAAAGVTSPTIVLSTYRHRPFQVLTSLSPARGNPWRRCPTPTKVSDRATLGSPSSVLF